MFKTGILNTIVIYVGIIIGFANVIFVYPLCLNSEEFGFRNLLFDTIVVLSVISSFGIPSAMLKWFPSFNQNETAFNTFFIVISALITLLFSGLFFFFQYKIESIYSDSSPIFVKYLFIIPILLFLYVANLIVDTFYKIHNKTVISMFFKEIMLRIMTACLCFLYYYEIINFDLLVYGFVIMYLVNLFFLTLILILTNKLSFKFEKVLFQDKKRLDEVLTYAFYIFVGSASSILVLKMDSLMIGDTGENSETRVGIYAMAVFIATLVEIPKRAFSQIINPKIAQLSNSNSNNQLKILYQQMSNTQFLLGTICIALIWNNVEELYQIIKNTEIYSQGIMVVLIIGLSKLVDMCFSYNAEIIGYSKFYRYNLYINLLLMLLAFLTNYYLIPLYGINGAAFASLISIFSINVMRLFFIKLKFGYLPFTIQSLKIMLFGFSILFIKELIIYNPNIYISVFMKSSCILAIASLYFYFDKNIRLNILKKII